MSECLKEKKGPEGPVLPRIHLGKGSRDRLPIRTAQILHRKERSRGIREEGEAIPVPARSLPSSTSPAVPGEAEGRRLSTDWN